LRIGLVAVGGDVRLLARHRRSGDPVEIRQKVGKYASQCLTFLRVIDFLRRRTLGQALSAVETMRRKFSRLAPDCASTRVPHPQTRLPGASSSASASAGKSPQALAVWKRLRGLLRPNCLAVLGKPYAGCRYAGPRT